MLVFIDESGDSGLKIDQGSSRYFTVALVCFDDREEALACDKRIELLKRELGWKSNDEFHFKKNSDKVRRAFLQAIAPYNFFYHGIVITRLMQLSAVRGISEHRSKLYMEILRRGAELITKKCANCVSRVINKDPSKLWGDGFRDKKSFYKYACGLVFSNAKEQLEHSIVVIDESGSLDFKKQLGTYLRRAMNSERRRVIKAVKMQRSTGNHLLQLADYIAGAINRSVLEKRKASDDYRNIVKHREIRVQIWPPK